MGIHIYSLIQYDRTGEAYIKSMRIVLKNTRTEQKSWRMVGLESIFKHLVLMDNVNAP